MRKHYVYFYGSTKVICGHNSLSEESRKRRNQLIGFEGIDKNPALSKLGEKCLYAKNAEGVWNGETGTLYPKENITIVPFRYEWCINNRTEIILKHLEDVIEANEKYIKAESIGVPLMELKTATMEGRNMLGKGGGFDSMPLFNFENGGNGDGFIKGSSISDRENLFANSWCCFGHFYLYLLKKALSNKGYSAIDVTADEKIGNLINTDFRKNDGTRLFIHADAGM
jgi:hypothetical protein